jgi:Na+/proline symporter
LLRGGGLAGLTDSVPGEGYFNFFNGPYSLVYVLGFFVLILLNYNAGWALVQRFYSVEDEGEARKVGLLAAGLNVIGPPLFYLPVMFSRDLLEGIENSRNAYAAMSLELLPVGMMGVMITAMFAATMSTLSSEYNVLASVATRDIYARLFRPHASEEHLLKAGRIFTLLIGTVILAVGLVVALYPDTPLFSIMVTVFGVAVGPMMLPLLGGLFFRRLSLRGAMAGFLVGLVVGFLTLGVQRFYLPGVAGLDPDWITFEFGAYAIFINVGATVLTMWAWTLFERRDAAEMERSQAFFVHMDTPVRRPLVSLTAPAGPSPFFLTGAGVMAIGGLLLAASFFTETATGTAIDLVAGTTLIGLGWLLYRTRPRAVTPDRPDEPVPSEKITI